jgi:hypothetical protein
LASAGQRFEPGVGAGFVGVVNSDQNQYCSGWQ